MNKKRKFLGCLLIGTALFLGGCGSNSSTTFSELYQSAGIEEQYKVLNEKQAVDVVDQLLVHRKYSMNRSIFLQQKIDAKETKFFAFMKDNMYKQFYGMVKSVDWQSKTGYMYAGRPLKFYLLQPDKEGKFGDSSTATLKEIKFSHPEINPKEEPSEMAKKKSPLEWIGINQSISTATSVWPGSGFYNGETWHTLGQLWTEDGVYVISDIHEDKKNHNSICIIAKPGDIATGIENGTFPFTEDLAYELLGSYIGYLDFAIDRLPLDMPEKTESELAKEEGRPPYYGPDNVSIERFGNVELLMPTIKKVDSTDDYTTFGAKIVSYMGQANNPIQMYVRIHKDGTKEISGDNQNFYKCNESATMGADVIWNNLAQKVAEYEGLSV